VFVEFAMVFNGADISIGDAHMSFFMSLNKKKEK